MTTRYRSVRKVLVKAPPREDGQLSVVEVTNRHCVLSTGVSLFIRWDKLQALAEQVCEERAAVTVRTWWTIDEGDELVELHRVGECAHAFAVDDAQGDAF